MTADPMDILHKVEDLDPELEGFLEEMPNWGTCIRHPLVYSIMHFPQLNAFVNHQLHGKKVALQAAEEACDWDSFIFLHERPYRAMAFQEVEEEMTDAEYWKLLGRIWIDSETIRDQPGEWDSLLQSERPDRQAIMNDDERADLAAMGAVIPVYQGHTMSRHDGWSWTTDLATAEWFAYRFASLEKDKPALSIGTVKRADVLAYFSRRNESEILIERGLVTITSDFMALPTTVKLAGWND